MNKTVKEIVSKKGRSERRMPKRTVREVRMKSGSKDVRKEKKEGRTKYK